LSFPKKLSVFSTTVFALASLLGSEHADGQGSIPTDGLRLWLASDAGITKDGNGFISAWADQSGNANDSIQNAASYQPQWVDNSLNGKPIVRFDGIDDQLVAASSAGSDNFTVFVVAKTSNTHEIDPESTSGIGGTSGQRYLFGALYPDGAGVSLGTNGISVYEHAPGYIPALAVYEGPVGSGYNCITIKYTAKQPQIFFDGRLMRTGFISPLATVNAPTQIGSGSYGAFGGDVAEVLIYNVALADDDRLAVEEYLNGKYGLITELPVASANLVATAISSTQTDLVWTSESANALNFKLERKVGATGTFALVATLNSKLTSYVDNNLSPGLQYFYRVSAVNLAGESTPSAEANATTFTDVSPVVFTGLMVWLRSDAGVFRDTSNRISTWIDQANVVRNGNDAKQTNIDAQPIWVDNVINSKAALQFDGVNDQLIAGSTVGANNFTIFVIGQATTSHEIDPESASSIAGTSGQRYLLGPTNWGADTGAGISMGTNGISVYEHGTDIMAPLAVDIEPISNFAVITLRYTSKQPQIYLNGLLRRTGLISSRVNTYAPTEVGSGTYGAFSGNMAELLIYNTALSDGDRAGVEGYLGRKYGVIDSDRDGLTDGEELQLGTDPYNPDTNGDYIPDGAEYSLGLDPISNDEDSDGLTNAFEYSIGTNAFAADSDGDGVSDGQDAYPLDPTRSQFPPGDPNDHTAPTITLIEPAGATLLP
jgi:hypothetical protein